MNVENLTDPLAELLSEIESITEGELWSIALDDVLLYAQISREDVMRAVYAKRRTGSLTAVNWEEFGQDNAADLVFILSQCGFPDAARMFRQRGYYLDEADTTELAELFLSVTISRMKSRPVDHERLEIAVAGSRSFSAAADFYWQSLFLSEDLVNFAVGVFIQKRGIENSFMARATAGRCLRRQFHLRILRWEDIYAAVLEDLRAKAAHLNLGEPEGKPDEELSPHTRTALKEMGFATQAMPSAQELKSRYRRLVKKYHPDVNPQGLEKTRLLNASYSHLIATAGQGD